jgi:thioredoxin reductase (NADPH)
MIQQELHAVAFPILTDVQINEVGCCVETVLARHAPGKKLVEAGDRSFKFFVIKAGEVEVLDTAVNPPRTLTVLRPGQFTGEVSQLSSGPSPITARARTQVEVYEITGDGVRLLINRCPELGDLILQAFIARRQLLSSSPDFTGLRVVGGANSKDTFRIRNLLARNRIPFHWLDLDTEPQVERLLQSFAIRREDTPVVAWGSRVLLRNPSSEQLADVIGLRQHLDGGTYDLAVVGSGPAGLAAAVYGASEGLRTVVLEKIAPGGQAGCSMRIENYLGFPTGLSGSELADRATLQAHKFGALLSVANAVDGLSFENGQPVLRLAGGGSITARTLLIATGARYRRLGAEGCERFEGCGVYYAATPNEATVCAGNVVVVVGGGNSAGQAALYLGSRARKVLLVVRSDDLRRSMSSYLVERIEQNPKIEVLLHTTVERMEGDTQLRMVELRNSLTGQVQRVFTPGVFSFIGAIPASDWLSPQIERDDKGFVRTGLAVAGAPSYSGGKVPFPVETSRAGVFAAGDVRAGSVKRVASAVGEGAMAVQFIHERLRDS